MGILELAGQGVDIKKIEENWRIYKIMIEI
jgi:hypothetical protein